MTRYAYFLGCTIPARVEQYDRAARPVLARLGIAPVTIRQFNCCGYPLRNSDPGAYLLSAVRNLALAEAQGLDMLVLCQCCVGSLTHAAHAMTVGGPLQDDVRQRLAAEGLTYQGRGRVAHLLSVLYHDVGVERIGETVTRPFHDLAIAAQNGCHGLRPSRITGFDDPVNPVVFDALVRATGARSLDWPLKLECCGAPVMGINDALGSELLMKKVGAGRNAGASYLCTACPYCHLQFDALQQMAVGGNGGSAAAVPAILYPQLLGLAMGIEPERLGLDANRLNIGEIVSFCSEE